MTVLGHVDSSGDATHWRTEVRSGAHVVVADEPHPHGADAGINPFGLLLAGLAACTNITLRMYAERKGWPLLEADVECTYHRDGDGADAVEHIDRVLRLHGDLDGEQRDRLADIAERTPVTLVVKRATEIRTSVAARR